MLKKTIAALALSLWASTPFAADGGKLVYDAEFVKLRAQNAEEWAAEDAMLREKLAEMRKRFGQPPNIIHIMWDDNSLGEVGIPEMNKVLGKAGYRTAFIGKAHQGDIEQSYMHNQGFDYANFSMYNQFPLINWHEFLGPSGAVQGLFESQWDRRYTVDREFRPLGYVNQLEARKGEKARWWAISSACTTCSRPSSASRVDWIIYRRTG
jgi:hypothetical protein